MCPGSIAHLKTTAMAERREEEGTIKKWEVVVDGERATTGQTVHLRGSVTCQLAEDKGSCVLIARTTVILKLDEVTIPFPRL